MRGYKKVLAVLLSAALLPAPAVGGSAGMTGSVEVKAADMEPEAQYESDVTKLQYVTPVEDQGGSDKCWAYMANAVLESYLKKTKGVSENFSEEAMPEDQDTAGGNYLQALAYWTSGKDKYGPVYEDNKSSDYYVTDVADLGPGPLDGAQDKEAYLKKIKSLVKEYGAAGVSVDFKYEETCQYVNPETGAYYKETASSAAIRTKDGQDIQNHGVAIVGWDDNYAVSNFKESAKPKSPGAFLVKNSWGEHPSSIKKPETEDRTGYFWMSYENYFTHAFAVCGVASRKELYDEIYESGGALKEYTQGDGGSSFLVNYPKPASADRQYLTAVATYVRTGCSYRFSVTAGDEGPAELQTADSGAFPADGYHVFKIDNPIPVDAAFQITAEVSTGGAVADIKPVTKDGHVCMKAFTIFEKTPSKPSVTAKTKSGRVLADGDWTNEDVTFDISGGAYRAVYEYAISSGDLQEKNWQPVTGSAFTCSASAWQGHQPTVYVRAKSPLPDGGVSAAARFQIGFDIQKPVISAVTAEPWTGQGVMVYVTVESDTLSGLAGYYVSEDGETPSAGAAWTALDEKAERFAFNSQKDTTYYIWVKDRAGNISEPKQEKVNGAVTVDTIAVKADSDQAPRGSVVRLTASVSGRNHPSQAVIWSVSGALDADTAINGQGELIVGCRESARELTVTAVAAADQSRKATCVIFPTAAQSRVTQIGIAPANVRVSNGGSQTFRATVYGTFNPAPLVTWNIWGNQTTGTYISEDGTLYVAADETADIIYVRAASKLDSTKSETVSITVGRSYTITAVSGAGGSISPSGSDSYQRGVSAVYTVRPYSGYQIADVKVDGVSVMPQLQELGNGTGNFTYTFESVTQTHTIAATFTANTMFTVTFMSDGKVCKTERVSYGGAATAPVIAKDGYRLSWDRSFTNVTSDITVNAVWMYAMTGDSGTDHAPGGVPSGNPSSGGAESKTVETIGHMFFALSSNGNAICSKNTASGKKRTKLVVPTTVSSGGRTYDVISVSAKCFKGNTKLKAVTIGRNVKRIGSAAFYGCKNLKTIAIKSTKVTAIGSRAFQKIAKNAIIYVPRSRLTKYRSMIRASGNTTARVRAYN